CRRQADVPRWLEGAEAVHSDRSPAPIGKRRSPAAAVPLPPVGSRRYTCAYRRSHWARRSPPRSAHRAPTGEWRASIRARHRDSPRRASHDARVHDHALACGVLFRRSRRGPDPLALEILARWARCRPPVYSRRARGGLLLPAGTAHAGRPLAALLRRAILVGTLSSSAGGPIGDAHGRHRVASPAAGRGMRAHRGHVGDLPRVLVAPPAPRAGGGHVPRRGGAGEDGSGLSRALRALRSDAWRPAPA